MNETTNKKTILIVEDERVVAKDLQRSLSQLGYHVPITVASSDEALRVVSEQCPDLVLMDIRIRGQRDGVETASLLKKHFDVPVVFTTAYADEETLLRAKKTEPHGYLVKPVRIDELRSTIEVILYKHQMERRLQERERWFSTTLRSIGDGVISTDPTEKIVFMNPTAEALTGWSSEEARGKTLSSILNLVDENTNSPLESSVVRALKEGTTIRVDGSLHPKNGQSRSITDSASPIMDDNGTLMGAVLVLRDVSEKKRLQRQIEHMERLASLGTIAAGIAHEVNNPLTYIMNNLFLALESLTIERKNDGTKPPYEIEDLLSEARTGAERIQKIIAELKAFSLPTPNTERFVSVSRAIEVALQIAKHEISSKATVSTSFLETPPIPADETRLGQVFTNLLLNAAQSFPQPDVERNKIQIKTFTNEAGYVVIEVSDNGCGMSEEIQKRIFEPFFTTKKVGHGTGLGLSVCHGIVASLGGTIEVQSQPNKGSTFRVLFPPVLINSLSETRFSSVPRSRLLLIDEPVALATTTRALSAAHDVTPMKSAGEALALLKAGARFDLIICDLMVGLSGVLFYKELKALDPEQAKRILFMTDNRSAQALDFLRSVQNAYIEKPIHPLELRRQADQLLSEFMEDEPL